MDFTLNQQPDPEITTEMNRLLEIGKILYSVLTDDEKEFLHLLVKKQKENQIPNDFVDKLGNTSVT